jgi:hypothetical protein
VGVMRRKKSLAPAVIEKILCDNPRPFSSCSGGLFFRLFKHLAHLSDSVLNEYAEEAE